MTKIINVLKVRTGRTGHVVSQDERDRKRAKMNDYWEWVKKQP